MSEPIYTAEITSVDGRILVTISAPTPALRFSRLFHAICDAERWLSKLARAGLGQRDWMRIQEKDVERFELAAMAPIKIVDKRRSKRCSLPDFFR
jgi:hypothetical protein